MRQFVLGPDVWTVCVVDPCNPVLIDRTGMRTVATTDPLTYCVYMSSELRGRFRLKVLIHEIAHCAMVSFGLLHDIWRLVPQHNVVEMEEWCCNFIADYGMAMFDAAYQVIGYEAIHYIPMALEDILS